MGLLTTLEQRSRLENPKVPISQSAVMEHFGMEPTPSGVVVNDNKSMGITAFWSAVGTICDTIASLPISVYEKMANGHRREATEHPVHQLLHLRPNPHMAPSTWKAVRMLHVLIRGNSYCEIEKNTATRPVALWPLLPDRTAPEIRERNKIYFTETGGARIALAADKVMHVPGMSYDGMIGYNVVKVHRDSLGLTVAANEYGARFFGNSGRPSGYISHPAKPSTDERVQLREEWNQLHTGLSNAQRTAILWGGMKWEKISLDPEDAQFLQTRELQIEEIARIFKINPILLQHHSKATSWGTGIAHFLLAYAKFTIVPWLVRDEEAMSYDLFTEAERGRFYVKYNINALLRGDAEMQAKVLEIERRNGVINADEWREHIEENPLPDGMGKHYYMPLNMDPVEAPESTEDGEIVETPEVELTALNGAQIASLMQILQMVSAKQIAPEAAHEALTVAFPTIDVARIAKMIAAAASFDPPQKPEDLRSLGVTEKREARSLSVRQRQKKAYVRMFQDGVTRYLRRDVEAAGKAIAKAFDSADPEAALNRWIDEFYPGQHRAIMRIMLPIVSSYAETIAADAAEEVSTPAPETDAFAESYTEALAIRETNSSIGQIRALMAESAPEQLQTSLVTRLAEWTDKRPAKVAFDEVSRCTTAAALLSWRSAGVPAMRWRANPGACPLCEQMDGMRVGTKEYFAKSGDSVSAEGTGPLTIDYDIAGPPLHQGCQCDIVPER